MAKSGTIRAGMGGWTFEPWRGTFYPDKLAHAKELTYAAEHVPTIEVNGTFYRTQTPATFAKWASETPEGFVFALKGPRYAVNRRVLAEAGDSIKRFVDSGPLELGDKLGPMLWQFAATKKFDAADFGAFLALLPHKVGSTKLRHVVEVRHDTFLHARVHQARARPQRANRLRRARDLSRHPRRHRRVHLRAAAEGRGRGKDRLRTEGARRMGQALCDMGRGRRAGRPECDRRKHKPAKQPRDAFVYFIHEGKVRAPHAAMALMERVRK